MSEIEEPELRPIKGGWGAYAKHWGVHGKTQEEAIANFRAAQQRHAEILARPDWMRHRGRVDFTGTAEDLARAFHETYEGLAPQFGYETREQSRVPWDEVPAPNRLLMIAVCAHLRGLEEDHE